MHSNWTNKTYYDVLGIDPKASDEQIKKAYKKLARTYHPDLNPKRPRSATDRFKTLQEAYSVLSDPISRQQYDELIGYSPASERFEQVVYESPSVWDYPEESQWKSFFRELSWRRKAAIVFWVLCLAGSFLPTSTAAVFSAGRFYEISLVQRLVWITIPLVLIWVGTWLADDESLDMSVGPVIKGVFGIVLEVLGWLYFARLIGQFFLGPLILMLS
jgi:hypothetical protein